MKQFQRKDEVVSVENLLGGRDSNGVIYTVRLTTSLARIFVIVEIKSICIEWCLTQQFSKSNAEQKTKPTNHHYSIDCKTSHLDSEVRDLLIEQLEKSSTLKECIAKLELYCPKIKYSPSRYAVHLWLP